MPAAGYCQPGPCHLSHCLVVTWRRWVPACQAIYGCLVPGSPGDIFCWVCIDVTCKVASCSLSLCTSPCRWWVPPGCQYADWRAGTRRISSCWVWVQPSGPQPKVLRDSFWVRPASVLSQECVAAICDAHGSIWDVHKQHTGRFSGLHLMENPMEHLLRHSSL